jgi:hypothetical protein
MRWSLHAVRAKERKRLEHANALLPDETVALAKLPKLRFDLRVNLERRDGGRLQYTLHHYYGKLIGQNVNLTPKQFGRKLGEIFELWMQE